MVRFHLTQQTERGVSKWQPLKHKTHVWLLQNFIIDCTFRHPFAPFVLAPMPSLFLLAISRSANVGSGLFGTGIAGRRSIHGSSLGGLGSGLDIRRLDVGAWAVVTTIIVSCPVAMDTLVEVRN